MLLTQLVNAISSQDPVLKDIFTDEFQTATQWFQFIEDRFGANPRAQTILEKTDGWTPYDFQALYIACWLYEPVAKGTYMIKLTDAQRTNVKSGYETLNKRWTSHLHEHGRSAAGGSPVPMTSSDWKFLKGYSELLVQLEGGGKNAPGPTPYLFLKCEGHTASHPAHFKSFFTKVFKGHGDTANAELEALAKDRAMRGLGIEITARAAENYSKQYTELLKTLGIKGKTTTVQAAAVRMFDYLKELTPGPQKFELLKAYTLAGFTTGPGAGQATNRQYADLLDNVIVPFAGRLPRNGSKAGKFQKAVAKSVNDLAEIAKRLRQDSGATGNDSSQRYFQEIVVDTSSLNAALTYFRKEMMHAPIFV